jgi:hypothetical protein
MRYPEGRRVESSPDGYRDSPRHQGVSLSSSMRYLSGLIQNYTSFG